MATLIAVHEIVFADYPQGYMGSESDTEGIAHSPDEMAAALKEFADSTVDAELVFTTNDGAKLYLLRQDGMLFMRSEHLDE